MEPELEKQIGIAESVFSKTDTHQLIFPGDPAYGDDSDYVVVPIDEIGYFPSRISVYDTISKESDYSSRRGKIIGMIRKFGFSPSLTNIDNPNYENNFLRDINIKGEHHVINLRLQSNLNCKVDYLSWNGKIEVYSGFFDPIQIIKSLNSASNDFTEQLRDFILEKILE